MNESECRFVNHNNKSNIIQYWKVLRWEHTILVPKDTLPFTIFLLFMQRDEYKVMTHVKCGCALVSHFITSLG